MKTIQSDNKKKRILSIILLLLLTVSIIYLSINQLGLLNKDIDQNNNDANSNIDQNNNDSSISPKTPASNQTDSKTTDTLGATITYIKQENDLLKIGIDIDLVTSTGECTLNLSKNTEKLNYIVEIQPLASSSTCKGFEIPVIELSPGNWDMSIEIKSGDKIITLTDSVIIE